MKNIASAIFFCLIHQMAQWQMLCSAIALFVLHKLKEYIDIYSLKKYNINNFRMSCFSLEA
jgi:hypothetical protein